MSEEREAQGKRTTAASQHPKRQKNQAGVFQQLVANEFFAHAAAAIEFHGAKRNAMRPLQYQCAMPNYGRKGNQNSCNRQSRAAHRDPSQQKLPAENFKP